jgi:hypothetical protein
LADRLSAEFVGLESAFESRATCTIDNMQGSITSGYLSWPTPGGMAVYFKPEGTGGPSDPGCGSFPYSYMIQSVFLELADSSMFGAGSGPGTLTFTVRILCPNEDGEPCSLPGSTIFTSSTLTMTVPPEGSLRPFTVPVNTCVDGPFFVFVRYHSWTGASNRTPSILWDSVARPACRQYITTDGGVSWVDHQDYFTSGDTGWAYVSVTGNTQDACGPSGNCGGPPPMGACCLPDGGCVDDLTPAECDALDGEFQGDDSVCASVDCPQPPEGACCSPEGVCTIANEFTCVGEWLGAGTACGGDCDGDGINDTCAIAFGLSEDCNHNGIPDECDIASGFSQDLNGNGIPDECEYWGIGDLNCDGLVNAFDIDPFVLALTDPVAYAATYPWCDVMLADINRDGLVNAFDIDPFVQLLTGGPPVITPTQLAGNSLAQYPYFEYVKAFNPSEGVEVAIDPTRFPGIANKTADIFVVEAKTAGEWAADPELVGCSIAVTFGATSIQENTFSITPPCTLNTTVYDPCTGANTGLGKGYDVVIDMNRNGVLDGGDYIDGLGREAGLYAVHDTSLQGPLAVTMIGSYSVGAIYGIPGSMVNERLYFPTNIASMCPLPIVIIGHGNGHDYRWYDHIGNHMASYGYIVMSHNNNTGPGIDSASLTTLGHTDAFISLGQSGSIPGAAALAGKLDTSRIIWIGHSRGAEGVAMAYHRLAYGTGTCSYSPDPNNNWDENSIVMVSSMCPTDFYGAGYTTYASCPSNPGAVNYVLWTGSADSDVSGDPSNDITQTFHLHDRATAFRNSIVLQGVGHAWYHAGGGSSWATGPCLIGQELTHKILLGLYLPLMKFYAEGNVPATDFFWRQYEVFRPPSVGTGGFCSASGGDSVVVNMTYRNGAEAGNFVIDDYQSELSAGVSSSGMPVTYTVQNLHEGRLDDNNTSFTWMTSDPMNGFTYAATTIPDNTRGVVFDWNGADRYYEWSIAPGAPDFNDYTYLSFRAGQATRHPYTIAVLGDLTFSVTLRDTAGNTSSINIGAYGGGVEEPYQRTGAGTGTGWGVEFETIRVRLTDFLTNGAILDLSSIEAVRLNFGPSWGSNEGRLGVEGAYLTNDHPAFFTPLAITVVTQVPEFLPPGQPIVVDAEIYLGDDSIVDGSALAYYRYDGGAYQTVPLQPVSGDLWRATLPAPACGDVPEFYVGVQGEMAGQLYVPYDAPATVFSALVGTYVLVFEDDFETDKGWTVWNDPSLTDGAWERAVPRVPYCFGEPDGDYDGSGRAYVTDNRWCADLDWGPTRLISPVFDLSGAQDPIMEFAAWWANDNQDGDPYDIELSNDGGATWVLVETIANVPPGWMPKSYYMNDYIALTSQMQLRISVQDVPNNSRTEGGFDALHIFDVTCP